MLGYKEDQPGSGQWYETSNTANEHPSHGKYDCWICAGHVFSVIFWSRKLAFRLTPVLSADNAKAVAFEIDQVEVQEGEIGFKNGQADYHELEEKIPYLAGSFTGWRYKSMHVLHEMT
jgi:hypothetical protein